MYLQTGLQEFPQKINIRFFYPERAGANPASAPGQMIYRKIPHEIFLRKIFARVCEKQSPSKILCKKGAKKILEGLMIEIKITAVINSDENPPFEKGEIFIISYNYRNFMHHELKSADQNFPEECKNCIPAWGNREMRQCRNTVSALRDSRKTVLF
jgi:hypothetical protein